MTEGSRRARLFLRPSFRDTNSTHRDCLKQIRPSTVQRPFVSKDLQRSLPNNTDLTK
jgi:hypothetical protein